MKKGFIIYGRHNEQILYLNTRRHDKNYIRVIFIMCRFCRWQNCDFVHPARPLTRSFYGRDDKNYIRVIFIMCRFCRWQNCDFVHPARPLTRSFYGRFCISLVKIVLSCSGMACIVEMEDFYEKVRQTQVAVFTCSCIVAA